MKLVSGLFLSLLISQTVHAKCSLSVMFLGANVRPEMATKLTTSLKQVLLQKDSKNTVKLIYSPYEAANSDYFYLLTQQSAGFRVAVNDILVNNTFYRNIYLNSAFRSSNEVIKTLALDFATDALPEMKYCQK